MQSAELPSDTETKRFAPSTAASPRERLDVLALELAQSIKLSHRAAHGSPVQTRLKKLDGFIRSAYHHFEEVNKEKIAISQATEWVLDNFYVIEQAICQVREGMPAEYYRRLPQVALDGQENVARIYFLSAALASAIESSLDVDQLNRFIQAYQKVDALKIGEVWALPLMLRLSMLETLATALANLTQIPFTALHPLPIPQADGSDAPPSADETLVINAILSLRFLATQDWKVFFERVSFVEQTLRGDPLNVYVRMDFETRNRYRNVVEKLARGCRFDEVQVAKLALQLAENGTTQRERHVGNYLIDAGRKTLEVRLAYRAPLADRLRNWLYEHPLPLYLGGIFLLTSAVTLIAIIFCLIVGASLTQTILAALFTVLPASAIAVDIVNSLVAHLIPPRILPKLDFQKGIPPECRTIVVIPVLLKGLDELRSLLSQIENHFLANPDPNLCFALLTDFADAPQKELPGEEKLIRQAREGIKQLNSRYGRDASQPFFLFHRERIWNSGEDCWMGWERKRGKLVEFNCLLRGKQKTTYTVKEGSLKELTDFRYVITLDADTILPRESAYRLVGTLAHPLNRAQFESETGRVKTGYTVLQPRVQVRPTVANRSTFARVYSGDQSLDLYTRAVSDVYQDLFGEGNYVGKGIYDVEAFERCLDGLVPDNHILSHDLFEGIHGRCGLVTDIVLFEDFPPNYLNFSHRLHRWVRGDWQLLPWLLPRVPQQGGGFIPNSLSILDRWKFFDNLRRSLITPAVLVLLLSGWFCFPGSYLFWTILALSVYMLPAFVSTIVGLRTRKSEELPEFAERRIRQPWLRALFQIIFLPHETLIIADAILTTLVRLIFTRKRLLQWMTAAHTVKILGGKLKVAWREMIVAPLFGLGILMAALAWRPAALLLTAPFLLSWLLSPYISVFISRPIFHPPKKLRFEHERTLRWLARSNWLYFEHFAGPDDHWLPPDHFQEDPRGMVAHRTSPTNIGLLLLSTLAAYDLGYVSPQELALRLSYTFDGMDGLERVRNHWLNWYDTRTLAPLPPRYISTVDSANLAACLLTLKQGCYEIADNPVIQWDGLVDTLEVLTQTLDEAGLGAVTDELPRAIQRLCNQAKILRQASQGNPKALKALFKEDRDAMEQLLVNLVETSAERLGIAPATWQRLLMWIDRTRHHITSIQREMRDLCPWELAMAEVPEWLLVLSESSQDAGSPDNLAAIWNDFHSEFSCRPALKEIPDLCVRSRQKLKHLQSLLPETAEEAMIWCENFANDLRAAKNKAQNLIEDFNALAQRAETYFSKMDFGFLFNHQRQVFHIGYNVESGRFDPNYYDLLASEARMAGLLAIARGDVPQSHWLYLTRPLTQVKGMRALISWSGAMFEYLLPTLLVKNYPDTLMGQSCHAIVERQIAYGREKNVPWGISESSYYHFDVNQVYQYRAFGVPGMGYKRGLAEDLVITPYASILALPFAPQAVIENLERFRRMRMFGLFGLYESVDFTIERLAAGQEYAIIRSYMAHHQGMALLALTNQLKDNPMPRRFHADPRIKSVELLLQEQTSGRAPIEHPHLQKIGSIQPIPVPVSFEPWHVTPDAPTPQIHCLTNGSYSLFLTAAGSGYSRWREIDLTRWRADTTLDDHGMWLYVQDKDNGRLWSAAFQPTGVPPESQNVHFFPHKVEFERRDSDISLLTSISIAADDDVEIRKVTLINHSDHSRRLVLTSYAEVILTTQSTDQRHPAFNNLFTESEYVEDEHVLLFRRRLRDSREKPVYLAHFMTGENAQIAPISYETDRSRFLGRGGSPQAPAALREGNLSNSTGATLDPIMALQVEIDLKPYDTGQIASVTVAAGSRKEALELVNRYRNLSRLNRAMGEVRREAERELTQIKLSLPLELIQKLLSALFYPTNAMRAAPDTIAANTLSQPGLWPFGISGDYPILLSRLKSESGISLLNDLLQAHTYWRRRGLMIDLVILNCRETSYAQDFSGQIHRLLAQTNSENRLNNRGGVFILNEDQMTGAERILLETAARVVLDEDDGPLSRQLGKLDYQPVRLPKMVPLRQPYIAPEADEHIERPPNLLFNNGLGGFSPDGREYIIYLETGQWTPAPWSNVIAQPEFGCLVTEAGLGCTWAHNSGENRLTPWRNDPVRDQPGEAIYLRDEDTGQYWSPTPLPARAAAPYLIRHGAGYSIFQHASHGLEQSVRVFVVPEAPTKIVQLRLHNKAAHMRRISVTYYAEWVLGTAREDSAPYLVPEFSKNRRALLARNPYNLDFGQGVAFLAATRELNHITTDRMEFLGRHGSYSHPAALERVGLAASLHAGSDPCAAAQLLLWLGPGETKEVTFLLGEGDNRADADRLISHYQNIEHVQAAWDSVGQFWDDILGQVQVKTPDTGMDIMLNRWLLYQALSCRIWGRTALYQSSGAFGFRDQLQDVTALVHTRPDLTHEHILRAASHQFEQGDVLHWWHPPAGRGIRTRCSDNLLWLPYVTAHYVQTTGDASILGERIPFLCAEPLTDDEEERYGKFSINNQKESLYEHCCRAILKGATQGSHGLPLIGAHDWNDGMNRVGPKGQGESIWLGWFLHATLENFAEMCERMGDDEQAKDFRSRLEPLRQAIEKHGWDGNWYLRAYYDDGTSLGSLQSLECQIDSLVQSWAVLSGASDPDRASKAMQSVYEKLVRLDDSVILLLTPPFDRTLRDTGYIQGYPPGVRENGGQYTHAAIWAAWAFAELDQGGRAFEIFRVLNPIYHANTPEKAHRYRVEPYVVAADVYGVHPHTGRGGWTWFTGSASWMYRLGLESILGLRRRGDRLSIKPCIPKDWIGYEVEYNFGPTKYLIQVKNPNGSYRAVSQVVMDGQSLPDHLIPLRDDGKEYDVCVTLE
ncbi:MAG: cellobiose phosphorylase [Acidobacteria bacterium]|nr:cellobiose phosphorylase [Acidobacteriota bacterium]